MCVCAIAKASKCVPGYLVRAWVIISLYLQNAFQLRVQQRAPKKKKRNERTNERRKKGKKEKGANNSRVLKKKKINKTTWPPVASLQVYSTYIMYIHSYPNS